MQVVRNGYGQSDDVSAARRVGKRRRNIMGDSKSRKDKAKSQKQNEAKHAQAEKKKHDKQHPPNAKI